MKAFLAIALQLVSLASFACTCRSYNPVSRFEQSRYAVLVKGTGTTEILNGVTYTHFKILEAFNGEFEEGEILKIDTAKGTSCEGPTASPYTHVVFLYTDTSDSRYSISSCSHGLMQEVELDDGIIGPNKQQVESLLKHFRHSENQP